MLAMISKSSSPVDPNAFRNLKRRVFLVHGRDIATRDALVQLMQALDLRVTDWDDAAAATGTATPYTGDVVRAGMEMSDAVVVLLTPDDLGQVAPHFELPGERREETVPCGQPRMNVIFEAGMAMAFNRHGTVLVEVGQLRPFTDTEGLNVVRWDLRTLLRAINSRRDSKPQD